MKKLKYTRNEVLLLINDIAERPDAVIDWLSNENTNWTADELLTMSEMDLFKKKPSKYESLEKRVEVLEQEVKKAKPDNESKNLWDKNPSRETHEELKNNFVSFVNYSIEKGWLPKPNNFHLSEVKRIVDEGKVEIPSWMERQKDADKLGKMYFGIDFGVSDSYNEIIMPGAFKIPTHSTHLYSEIKHETESVPARVYNELKSLNKTLKVKNDVLANENTKLKLTVEELEAVNAEILKGSGNSATVEDLKISPVASFELKKWYKSTEHEKMLIFPIEIDDQGHLYGYGFSELGTFGSYLNNNGWNCLCNDVNKKWLIEATESEVLEALTKEAVKRGFVEGAKYKPVDKTGRIMYYQAFVKGNDFRLGWMKRNNLHENKSEGLIFENGIWAEIIK